MKAIGLLGISEKYHPIEESTQKKCLNFITSNFDIIDTSSVYGESIKINKLLSQIPHIKHKKNPLIVNKLGADLGNEHSVDALIAEYIEQKILLESFNIAAILLHRPSKELVKRDLAFYDFLKRDAKGIRFGICTNNLEVFKEYSRYMKIDILQVAVNLLDYKNNLRLLKLAKKNKAYVMARSCLSSGILTGKYLKINDFNFSDPIRSRFIATYENKKILKERLLGAQQIKQFYEKEVAQKKGVDSFINFIYSVTEKSKFVDIVLRGGSNQHQIEKNLINQPDIPESVIKQVYNKYINRWACRYL